MRVAGSAGKVAGKGGVAGNQQRRAGGMREAMGIAGSAGEIAGKVKLQATSKGGRRE